MSDSSGPLAYVCGYAEDDGGGVFRYRLDPADGTLRRAGKTASEAAMFAGVHPDRTRLYTANRVSGGVLTAYRVGDDGDLGELNRQSSEGEDPAYVSFDSRGRYAFVANYTGGTIAMVPIETDGRLGPATDVVEHEGSSVNPDRQGEPHPHSIVPGPDDAVVYVPDLGTDRIEVYRIDDRGRFRHAEDLSVTVHDGAGPRHFDVHPSGRFAYLLCELDGTVVAYERDPESGALAEVATVNALPEGFDGHNQSADVHVHPSGNWLYATNRGPDALALFDLDDETGRPTRVGHESTRGHWPRHFALDPTGRYLFAENRRSDSIVGFEVDAESGRLSPTGQELSVPEPVCLRFVPSG